MHTYIYIDTYIHLYIDVNKTLLDADLIHLVIWLYA